MWGFCWEGKIFSDSLNYDVGIDGVIIMCIIYP